MLRYLLVISVLLMPLGVHAQSFDDSVATRPKLKLESMCKDAQRGGQCFGCHRVVSNPKPWPQVAQSFMSWERAGIAALFSRQGGS